MSRRAAWISSRIECPVAARNRISALRRAGLEVVGSAHGLAFDRAQIDAAFEVKGKGAVHALACGDKATGRKLICVNPTKAEATVTEKVKGFKTPFKVPAMSVIVK